MDNTKKRPLENAPSDEKKVNTKDSSFSDNEAPFDIQSARGKRLVLPKKRVKASQAVKEEQQQGEKGKEFAFSKETMQEVMTGKLAEKKGFDCTYCGDTIYPPYPPRVDRLIKKIDRNQKQYEKEQRVAYEQQVLECKKDNMFTMPFIVKVAGISQNDKSLICRTHRIELVFKPMAKEKGYPEHIDFAAIADRIALFQDEIVGIIERKLPSSYLDAAYARLDKLGMKARNTNQMLAVFQDFQPGYYGVRGTDIIMQTLFTLFLKTHIIDYSNVHPLTPVEFIQQILVPETGIRLIRQDRDNNIDLVEAKRIMKESQEYGSIVHYKVKKDKKKMADDKKDKDKEEEEEEEENVPLESITFDNPLSMQKANDDADDDDQSEDVLSSQLSMASQGDEPQE